MQYKFDALKLPTTWLKVKFSSKKAELIEKPTHLVMQKLRFIRTKNRHLSRFAFSTSNMYLTPARF